MKLRILFSVIIIGFNLDCLADLKRETNQPYKCKLEIIIYGNIEYKHVYSQGMYRKNVPVACLPFNYQSKKDNSKFFIVAAEKSLQKTQFKVGYDTCSINYVNIINLNTKKYNEFFPSFGYIVYRDTVPLDEWDLKIVKLESQCNDTDFNRVTIRKDKNNYIEFSCLQNVIIEELDLDKDGEKEVYVFSYGWCTCELEVYRVNVKLE